MKTLKKTLVAKINFEGWENFGTVNQKYVNPQTLEKIEVKDKDDSFGFGNKDVYFLNNVEIEQQTAFEFIHTVALEKQYGTKQTYLDLTCFNEISAQHGHYFIR